MTLYSKWKHMYVNVGDVINLKVVHLEYFISISEDFWSALIGNE